MLKKMILALFVAGIEIAICVNVQYKLIYAVFFAAFDFMLAGIFICYRKYSKYMSTKFPSLLVDLERNYDILVLGNHNEIKQLTGTILNLQNYNRNLYTDYLLIQRWYSLTRKDGSILIQIDLKDHDYFSPPKINILDYPLLHSVTLLEHGISCNYISNIYHKIKASLCYVTLRFKRVKGVCINTESTCKQMKALAEFCTKRERSVRFCISNCNIDVKNQLLKTGLNIKFVH